MPVTAVVFDVGNVLYHWDPRNLYRQLIADEAALERFLHETDFVAWHFELDGGRVYAEAAEDLGGRFPHHRSLIDAWGPRFGESIGDPVAGMRELVEELDGAGVPLFAITNFSAEFWTPFAAKESALFDRFRDIVVSGEEKMVKPDPAIFALALDRFRLTGPEALFVDDRADNVAAAEAAGMRAHLFTDEPGLRARLVAEGLLF
ncbi:MAG: Hydrolase, haloacid dehalogenase-like family [uncultured Sphingomonadaceae bacterium]|uniref:Hydrolase, haloacid dehalogenase-like family n=1 Tax=uncultured Sphingomonadaceae bacterium TaxID=169976 RepID=A0A6J4TBR5_9SPHN|nr:MAG: Hydrolase, haloacid dehalogenase-like family [uncultured Sphingomonadaceae bacterium]